MNTQHKKANISDKDYRVWYMLNEKATISVKTSVGESDFSTITNSLGQGSFGNALASSLNIGCAVEDTFKGDPSTSLGFMDLRIAKSSTFLSHEFYDSNLPTFSCNINPYFVSVGLCENLKKYIFLRLILVLTKLRYF